MPSALDAIVLHTGYRPGAIGDVTALHGRYYANEWGFDQRFEVEVARELAEFVERFDKNRDGLWLALHGDSVVGAIAIDGGAGARPGARLRWFILDPAYHGQGLGRRLIQAAMGFAAERDFEQVYLMTFAGLKAARRIYETCGFRLVDEHVDNDWNANGVTHQTFVHSHERET